MKKRLSKLTDSHFGKTGKQRERCQQTAQLSLSVRWVCAFIKTNI